jgi:hypothetical protein
VEQLNQRSSANDKLVDQTNFENAQTLKALEDGKATVPSFNTSELLKGVDSALKNHESARIVAAGIKVARLEQEARDAEDAQIDKELPGTLGSITPFYGSIKSSAVHYSHGNYGRTAAYGALAISDVFLVKSLVLGGGRLLLRGGTALLAASEAERIAPKLIWAGGETQWGAALRTPTKNNLTFSGFRLAPNPTEIEVARVSTPRVLARAAEVGERDIGHNFPKLLDPLILSSERYLKAPRDFSKAWSISYHAPGSIGYGQRATQGAYEIGVVEGAFGEERIIHRSFTRRIHTFP